MSALKFSHEKIASLLPHASPMVLLDAVLEYGEGRVVCCASSHRSELNPLRVGDVLPVYSGLEYAAQAMALYSQLSSDVAAGVSPKEGYVAVTSKLVSTVESLHNLDCDLIISVQLLDDAGDSSLFEFKLEGEAKVLLSGRLLVVLSQSA